MTRKVKLNHRNTSFVHIVSEGKFFVVNGKHSDE